MRYFEDEAWWAAVASSHLLKQDCVDAQTGGRVGRLAQETRGQAEERKQETTSDTTAGQGRSQDVNDDCSR